MLPRVDRAAAAAAAVTPADADNAAAAAATAGAASATDVPVATADAATIPTAHHPVTAEAMVRRSGSVERAAAAMFDASGPTAGTMAKPAASESATKSAVDDALALLQLLGRPLALRLL